MTFERQQELFKEFTEEMERVMFKKGADYANTDRLSNFKLSGAVQLIEPANTCLGMMVTKVIRLGNLLQPGKVPNNESIEDSALDLANYSFLLYCILTEKKELEDEKKKIASLQKYPDLGVENVSREENMGVGTFVEATVFGGGLVPENLGTNLTTSSANINKFTNSLNKEKI